MNSDTGRIASRRNEAIAWARSVLENKEQYVIFDTETTGLKDSDVIVHFAVMDLDGAMLIDTKVKPTSKRRMSSDATYLHGLTMKELKDAPLFEEVLEMLRPISDTKRLLSFNARFHAEMIQQTCYNEGTTNEHIRLDCYDVKDWYQKFVNQERVSLPGRKNTGVGDCTATLAVIQKMAAAEMDETRKKVPDGMVAGDVASVPNIEPSKKGYFTPPKASPKKNIWEPNPWHVTIVVLGLMVLYYFFVANKVLK